MAASPAVTDWGFYGWKAVNGRTAGPALLRCALRPPWQQSCGAPSQRRNLNSSKDTIFFFLKFWLHWVSAAALPWGVCKVSCLAACRILAAWPGTEPVSPALEGRFLTNGPPGKSQPRILFIQALPEAPNYGLIMNFKSKVKANQYLPVIMPFNIYTSVNKIL